VCVGQLMTFSSMSTQLNRPLYRCVWSTVVPLSVDPRVLVIVVIIIGVTSVFHSYERVGRFPIFGRPEIGLGARFLRPDALPVRRKFDFGEHIGYTLTHDVTSQIVSFCEHYQ